MCGCDVGSNFTQVGATRLCGSCNGNDYTGKLVNTKKLNNAFEKKDAINPDHYKNNGLETIDVIKAWLTKEEYIGFLKGNMLKYQSRAGKKENNSELQDYKKINWYQNKLIEELQRD